MKIVLQCNKCLAVSIEEWIHIQDDGTLSIGRMEKQADGRSKWNIHPRCHNCKSDELTIGTASLSGLSFP